MKLLLVDDHVLFREGVALLLRSLEPNVAGTTHYSYFYNGLGQRTIKQTSSMHAFSSTSYAYDERGQLLYELAAAGATDYLYLDGLPVGVVVGGQIYYVETDQLGTPREVANTSNGLRWKWDYFGTTFGETAPNQNPSGLGTFTFNLRFPGQYYDAETGNHYNYFRDYEPQIGRYVESDPIGVRGGINTYAYAHDDPLAYIDPNGLLSCNGRWRLVGTKKLLPQILGACQCFWLCVGCNDGAVAWSGDFAGLPWTLGAWIWGGAGPERGRPPTPGRPEPPAKPGVPGRLGLPGAPGGGSEGIGSGNVCICNNPPGQESGCQTCGVDYPGPYSVQNPHVR